MRPSYIVFADGGSRGNPGPAAFGTVILDGVTKRVLAEIGQFVDHATNNVAEYRGAIAGLEYVHKLSESSLIRVNLDSKLVVEQMSGRWKIKSPDMRSLALRARDAHPPTLVQYVWVPREDNHHADSLVNEILDSVTRGGSDSILREL